MPAWSPEPAAFGEPPACPHATEVPAYLQGELSPAAAARFERHLKRCASCRAETSEAREVLGALGSCPKDAGGDVDLVPRLLAEIERLEPSARRPRTGILTRRVVAVAALALLALGLGLGVGVQNAVRRERALEAGGGKAPVNIVERPDQGREGRNREGEGLGREGTVALATDWLARAQEPSGKWSAERWGGQARFEVALTGLALLALLHGGSTPEGSAPVTRAVEYLLAQQAEEGRFGAESAGSIYNHGIATVALLETFARRRDDRLRGPLDRAVRHLRGCQSEGGGWGYPGEPASGANTAATSWPLQALLLARALGWEGLDAPIAAGFSHLLRACDEAGRIGYRRSGDFPYGPDGLSSMGALCVLLDHDRVVFPDALRRRLVDRVLRAQVPESPARRDLYREFFLSSALHVLPPGHAGRSREDLPRLLAAEQVRVGPHRGTWEAIGPWAAAGGRLCSTALAALILESPERGRRLKGWTEPGSRG